MTRFFITVVVITCLSCKHRPTLKYTDFVGKYYNGPDSSNYNDMLLRADSSYLGNSSYRWGDNLMEHNGLWRISGDTIILYRANDFSDLLIHWVPEQKNGDTLVVDVTNLLRRYPVLRVSVGERDFPIVDGKVKIVKPEIWAEYPTVTVSDWENMLPTNVMIRVRNGFARIHYFNTDANLRLTLPDSVELPLRMDTIFCKYYWKDSILFSFEESRWIEKHNLRRARPGE